VVLLKEKAGERLLPIWVGPHEGDLIKLQLAEQDTPRPLAYELMKRLLDVAQATVERVVVSRLHEQVFYATLFVRIGNRIHEVDARPSDALPLAMRVGAPLFVAPEIMEAQGVKPEALEEKLGKDQAQPAPHIMWVSAPVPRFNPPPSEKK
jgi:bifunctional DNase/RNase